MSRRRRSLLLGAAILTCVGVVAAWPRLRAEYYYVRIVLDPDPSEYTRYFSQLENMGRPAAVLPLLRLLHDDNPLNRDIAARRLEQYPTPRVIDALLAAAQDPQLEVRIAAVTTLGEIDDARVVSTLRQIIDRNNEVESSYARIALLRLAERGVIPSSR